MKKYVPFLLFALSACTKEYQTKPNLHQTEQKETLVTNKLTLQFKKDTVESTKPSFIACNNGNGVSDFAVNIQTSTPIIIQQYQFGAVGDTAELFSVAENLGQAPGFFNESGSASPLSNDTVKSNRTIVFHVHYKDIPNSSNSGKTARVVLQAIQYEALQGAGNPTYYGLSNQVASYFMYLVGAYPAVTLYPSQATIQNGVINICSVGFNSEGGTTGEKNIPLQCSFSGSGSIDQSTPFTAFDVNHNPILIKTIFQGNGKVNIIMPQGFSTTLQTVSLYAKLEGVTQSSQLKIGMQPDNVFHWIDITGGNVVFFSGITNETYLPVYPDYSVTLSN